MHDAPTCGSLFSGAGLLDVGLAMAGFEHAWVCESDELRRDLLAKRFPEARAHGDIRTLRGQAATDAERGSCELRGGPGELASTADDPEGEGDQRQRGGPAAGDSGARARSVDLIAGGFPCKGASSAGKQNGFEHAETFLWHEMRRVIGEVRPRYVLVENVRDALSIAAGPGEPAGSLWGVVLADLASLGFDVRWDCVPAAAVGAPHLRDRVYAVATHPDRARRPAGREPERPERERERHVADEIGASPAADAEVLGQEAPPFTGRRAPQGPRDRDDRVDSPAPDTVDVDWGDYQPAITRWEAVHGPAPEPLVRRLDDGDAKLRRVRARVDRSRLSALGDGVHVYCAYLVGLAIRHHMRHGTFA